MWYVGGSRPDGAQVERFSSWGTVVPKGFLAESAYFSSRIYVILPLPNQRGHPRIGVNQCCTKEGNHELKFELKTHCIVDKCLCRLVKALVCLLLYRQTIRFMGGGGGYVYKQRLSGNPAINFNLTVFNK